MAKVGVGVRRAALTVRTARADHGGHSGQDARELHLELDAAIQIQMVKKSVLVIGHCAHERHHQPPRAPLHGDQGDGWVSVCVCVCVCVCVKRRGLVSSYMHTHASQRARGVRAPTVFQSRVRDSRASTALVQEIPCAFSQLYYAACVRAPHVKRRRMYALRHVRAVRANPGLR